MLVKNHIRTLIDRNPCSRMKHEQVTDAVANARILDNILHLSGYVNKFSPCSAFYFYVPDHASPRL